ncbi:MAG TPA: GNAT family N-acetyltransferase [Candidatus Obscuribacterales bacterium]
MALETAEWQDLLPVFRETYRIWSPGLTPERYREHLYRQTTHPWARRHLRYLVLRRGNKIVTSCKLYEVTISSRGHDYRFGGIGAVYTQEAERGLGYATELMQEIIVCTQKEGYDGLLLFSDIGDSFYLQFGFDELGSTDVYAYIPRAHPLKDADCEPVPANLSFESWLGKVEAETVPLERKHIARAAAHYGRWLRSAPYGFKRTHHYWDFKLSKEQFLNAYSRLSWPCLQITFAAINHSTIGYAITECAGATLRILEVIGSGETREVLWQTLLLKARADGITRIRGWEANARDFAPSYSLKRLARLDALRELQANGFSGQLNYYERGWGRGMILCFNPETRAFQSVNPCPILELDHL